MKDLIQRSEDASIGNCEHCGGRDVLLLAPEKLAPYFDQVLEAYVPRRNGRHLDELLAEDWATFAPGTDVPWLLEGILGEAAAGAFVPRLVHSAPSREAWQQFRKELQETNRFFPKSAPNPDTFTALIGALVQSDLPEVYFRARLQTSDDAHPLDKMGAPPADVASEGRANPVGIRYLYLADDLSTAVAEVKPAKGALVSVAKFRVEEGRNLKIVDLTHPRLTISPFGSSRPVAEVRASMSFLEALRDELSIPTQPHRATRDYLASQYLCEFIKVSGYDGVIYQSSLAPGRNFAFFDAEAARPYGEVEVHSVTDVAIAHQKRQ